MGDIRVKTGRRLVEKQDFRFGQDRLRQRQPRHLSGRQFAGHFMAHVFHLEFFDHVIDSPVDIRYTI